MNRKPDSLDAVNEERVRALLQAGRAQSPVHYRVEEGLVQHRAHVLRETAPPELDPLASRAFQSWNSAKLIGLASIVGMTSLGGFLILGRAPANPAPAAAETKVPIEAHPSTDGVQPAVSIEPAQLRSEERPTRAPGAASIQPRPTAGDVKTSERPPRGVAPARRAAKAHASSTPQSAKQAAGPVQTGSATSLPLVELAQASAPERPARPPADMPAADDLIQREIEELAHAERLMRTNPAQALAIARASDARYRPGYLRPERRYVIVRALIALKRVDEARAEVAWLLRNGASGELAERLRQAVK